VNGFQHEQPDYWLTFGNPWEIERLIVSYPIKFYGHVSVETIDGRQIFKWNAGETVRVCVHLVCTCMGGGHCGRKVSPRLHFCVSPLLMQVKGYGK
jgi:glucan phosphorylase